MKRTPLLFAGAVALALLAVVLGAYFATFGGSVSDSHTVWAEFGSYVGGSLGAAFAALAFFVLVATLALQQHEFGQASRALNEQLKLARSSALSQEYLAAFKDTDARLQSVLETTVSTPAASPVLTIALMIAEADRISRHGGVSPAYRDFLELGREPGSIVEAHVRTLIRVCTDFCMLLDEYSKVAPSTTSPLIVYYARKAYRVAHLLEDLGHSEVGLRKALDLALTVHSPR